MILIVVSIFSMLVFQFRFLWFSISSFVVFNIFICVFQYFQFPHLWFQFLHLWFWISLFVVSISSFVIFNIFNFFICGFSIFFFDRPSDISKFFYPIEFLEFTLPTFLWHYRVFSTALPRFLTALPRFFDHPTVVFSTALPCFFRSPYQVGGSTLFSLIWANFKNVPPSQNVRAKGYEDCHGNTRRSN